MIIYFEIEEYLLYLYRIFCFNLLDKKNSCYNMLIEFWAKEKKNQESFNFHYYLFNSNKTKCL